MAYRKIMVGTDGSETAKVAEEVAARLAKRFRAKLLIVSGYELERVTRERAHVILEEARERARALRVEADVEAEEGEPSDVVIDLGERRDVDLIVLGNLGMGKPTRFRLGSVPDRVAHLASSDVLIVETSSGRGRDDARYHNVLIGTDGSPTATEAARKGFELALLLGADVTLVHVGDPLVGAIALERTAEAALPGTEVHTRQVEGEPAEAICALAEREEVDLIVVGNKGMSGARRYLLGSVPNRVAHHAPTDVLIAKTIGLSLDDIAPGHGGIVELEGKRLAVYRDQDGALRALVARCTHMGCTVGWNDTERTWDCPCHGSRYDLEGRVIRGPAAKPLAPQEVEEARG